MQSFGAQLEVCIFSSRHICNLQVEVFTCHNMSFLIVPHLKFRICLNRGTISRFSRLFRDCATEIALLAWHKVLCRFFVAQSFFAWHNRGTMFFAWHNRLCRGSTDPPGGGEATLRYSREGSWHNYRISVDSCQLYIQTINLCSD